MINPNFKKSSLIVLIALACAVLFLAAACILPVVMINRLETAVREKLDNAIMLVENERYDEAAPLANDVKFAIEKQLKGLELFFGHEALYELYGAAECAAAITPTGDSAQILEELCGIDTALKYLISINRASIYNLM